MNIDLNSVYAKSANIILNKMEDEYIMVTIHPGQNGRADELYILNQTGVDIWERLNGKTPLDEIVRQITSKYNSVSDERIRQDVLALVNDLFSLNMIVLAKERE